MKRLLVALAVLPLITLAQADGAAKPGPGPDAARLEKRMRLARTLGLAEALDLDTAQALKLGESLARFDERRKAIRKQAEDASEALRRAAANDKATAAEVDGAIARLLDARTQLLGIDREALQAVMQGLPPDRRARAALFLGQFHRMERRMMPGTGGGALQRGRGMHGPGMRGAGAADEGGHGMAMPLLVDEDG